MNRSLKDYGFYASTLLWTRAHSLPSIPSSLCNEVALTYQVDNDVDDDNTTFKGKPWPISSLLYVGGTYMSTDYFSITRGWGGGPGGTK